MKSSRDLEIGPLAPPLSMTALGRAVGMAPPISLTALFRRLSQKTFHQVVTAPAPEALGGSITVTIRGDGTLSLKVHMHDSGAPSYAFRLGIFLRATSGRVIALYSHGTVRGTDYAVTHPFATGFREFDDTPPDDHFPVLDTAWPEFAEGSLSHQLEYSNSLTDFVTSAILGKVKFIAGAVILGGPATLVLLGNAVLRELTGAQLPENLMLGGLVAAETGYFLVGPGGFIPLFIAGALVTAAAFRGRPMRADEIAAAETVFKGTLDYAKITITEFEDARGRNFASPTLDGGVVIGAGSNFDNYLQDDLTRHTFIHELTHAWQAMHGGLPVLSCDGIERSLDENTLSQDRIHDKYYAYQVDPGKAWSEYGPEQQAEIVADYDFIRNLAPSADLGTRQKYIDENIRMGRP